MRKARNLILFENSARQDVLGFFGKTTDAEGYIVENTDPMQRVVTPENEEVKLKKFAGIQKGSHIFFVSQLRSLMNLVLK